MSIPVEFEEITEQFQFSFSEENETFEAEFRDLYFAQGAYYERFEGPYEVTPVPTVQTLGTRDKVMEADLTVKAIPFYEVTNPSGGNTVYIGSEV